MTLSLYTQGATTPLAEFVLDPSLNRTGDVWHAHVAGEGVGPGIEYAWRCAREPNDAPLLHRHDPRLPLLDPWAEEVAASARWGEPPAHPPRARVTWPDDFDWEGDRAPGHHPADAVIYELHVRGFTRHASSGVAHPGTYAGLIEKIPYLVDLGVTAIELLPVAHWEETDSTLVHPRTGERLLNLWGYQPLAWGAPKAGLASDPAPGAAARELKTLIKALHAANLEVYLDVVYNHTGEGTERHPTRALRGLDNASYYIVDPTTGHYRDVTGCGNTVQANHPVAAELILGTLRRWVIDYHVDGFRFDLASALARGPEGQVLEDPPLLAAIAGDPVLARVKLIAEAWDAVGLYQVGSFAHGGRFAEWNGRFRDDVRRFVRGDDGALAAVATRLAGSADLYQGEGRPPWHSINFVTSHDGFPLADLVAYDTKHNEDNGEGGRDGDSNNVSWNCGVEGPTDDPAIVALRRRQRKNFLTILFLAQGTPMMTAGDELGRTQGGNNNAWCQDDETSWVDWSRVDAEADQLRFVRRLLRFRKAHAILRRKAFAVDVPGMPPWISWHGEKPGQLDWNAGSHGFGMQLHGGDLDDEILVLLNAGATPRAFALPKLPDGHSWHRSVDTALAPPQDAVEPGEERELGGQDRYELAPRSAVVLVGRQGR